MPKAGGVWPPKTHCSARLFERNCRNPTLRQVWGWNSHSQKWELGVLWDSWNFRVRLQKPKHLALRCSSYRSKGLEVWMSKMVLHEPFGHLPHKLWSKERSGVKLTIWLPIIKSRESTQSRCVCRGGCETPFESSQGELQLCFRPHPDRRSEKKVMTSQSLRSPNRDNFETALWESRDKKPFGRGCGGVT
jgi:hypothetical protein